MSTASSSQIPDLAARHLCLTGARCLASRPIGACLLRAGGAMSAASRMQT